MKSVPFVRKNEFSPRARFFFHLSCLPLFSAIALVFPFLNILCAADRSPEVYGRESLYVIRGEKKSYKLSFASEPRD